MAQYMDGFKLARAVTKKYARTFYFASLFLKKEKRGAAYAVYAACRISDETVDDAASKDTARQRLEELRGKIDAVYSQNELNDPLLSALRETVNKYTIPRRYFDELISGVRMDLEKNRFASFKELYEYCYKVAGVVGLIMLKIFGSNDEKAYKHAEEMGIAMQLTNILRDIKEDWQRGRIYLPQDEMKRFGVGEQNIREGKVDDDFRALMEFQIERAREYYRRSNAGIAMLADANSRFVAKIMSDIYAGILTDIEKSGYNVYNRRAHVNMAGKIMTVINILRKGDGSVENRTVPFSLNP